MLQAMDNTPIKWNQNKISAVTLLQGTSRKGFIDIEEIEKMAALIEMVKNHKKCVSLLHNSPCLLRIPPLTSQELLTKIEKYLKQSFEGKFDSLTDDLKTIYNFNIPHIDVTWISQYVYNQWSIKAEAKPLFTPKIKLEFGPAGSNVVNMEFINLDERKKYLFTIRDGKIVGDGVMPT